MKTNLKLIALSLAAAALLSACSDSESGENDSSSEQGSSSSITESGSTSSESSTSSTSGSSTSSSGGAVLKLRDLPEMDGSTSAVPLEIGLKSKLLNLTYSDAEKYVSHTTTHEAFKRLISGEVDLILSVPISEEQQALADEAGVTLVMEPIAREGFVFAVNAENPVDELTSEQLRKIYSGEITNWSQVGGRDEKIIPYQRNQDSGSQNYMTEFMGDTPLAEPPSEYVKGGMAGIMDAIAVYDNSAGAIGYSVYSYAAQMYANANKVKFIAVDGVAPSKATMADESYPLLSCTYAIYTDRSPEKAKKFVELASSDEGQTYVLESGYLPVNGMDVPAKYLPYEAVGTGVPRPADADFSRYSTISAYYFDSYDPITTGDSGYLKLRFLKDKDIQDKINADIAAATDRLNDQPGERVLEAKAVCRNGYLSIALYRPIAYFGLTYSCAETLTYDLFTGEKLERLSDLFFEGEDFVPMLNERVGNELSIQADNLYMYEPEELNIPKLDFSGLLGEQRLFTLDSIGFEPDNLYFVYGQFTDYLSVFDFKMGDLMCVAAPFRDMSDIISDEWQERLYNYEYNNEWITEFADEDGDIYLRVVDSFVHTDAEVKARDEFWHELQRRRLELIRKSYPSYVSWSSNFGEEKNCYYIRNNASTAEETYCVYFDRDTLEPLTLDDLLKGDGRQYIDENDAQFAAEFDTFYPSYWWDYKSSDSGEAGVTIFAFPDKPGSEPGRMIYFNVPIELMNERYFEPQNQ